MGMTCSLHRVPVGEVEQLRKNPDTLQKVLGSTTSLCTSPHEGYCGRSSQRTFTMTQRPFHFATCM
jgi:hypothetical protein